MNEASKLLSLLAEQGRYSCLDRNIIAIDIATIETLMAEERRACVTNLKKKSPSGVIPQWMIDACIEVKGERDG